jgi:hypothetical protein
MSEWNKNPEWTPKEMINNGEKFSPNDVVSAEDFNALVENIAYLYISKGIGYNKLAQLASGDIMEVTAGDLEGATTIRAQAFMSCKNLTRVQFPQTLRSISGSSFAYCTSLAEVIIPNNVTSIGGGTFRGCTSLKNIILPTGITDLYSEIFNGCGLMNIKIPQNVTKLYAKIFRDCSALQYIEMESTSPPSIDTDTFDGIPSNTVFYVPSESVEVYKSATNWSAYADRIFAIEE